MPHYRYSGSDRLLSADEVYEKDTETQLAIMREWFEYHFEDPAEKTPSLVGGYIYFHGGPYDPYDVLGKEFDDIVLKDVIHILAKELCQTQTEWAPTSRGNYYSDDTDGQPFEQFNDAMKNISILLSTEFHNTHSDVVSSMHRLLYANIIIAIEVYLSDTFKSDVRINSCVTRRFVETTSFFKEQKTSISDVYNNMDSIKNIIDTYLTTFPWHKLDKTKKIYEDTFGIKFPENMKTINKAILVRHDIMHRNGKTKNGEYHKINKTDVKDLIDEAQKFVSCIEEEINNKNFYIEVGYNPSI